MKRVQTKLATESPLFVLAGLCCPTIHEQPVSVCYNNKPVGSFQAIEVFERDASQKFLPQTIADLVCNTYIRLSMQKSDGTSGTFGSSAVGAMSFRSSDKKLNFIPQISEANIKSGSDACLSVSLSGTYGECASLSSVRHYRRDLSSLETKTLVEVRFRASHDILLDSNNRGDRFRLMTASSMYTPQRYDANILHLGEGRGLNLTALRERNLYIFDFPHKATLFELRNSPGSKGRRGTPGAPDTPCLKIEVIAASMPLEQVGVQAFLASTTNINHDSLSVWLEWLDCPATIVRDTEVWAQIELTASFYPGVAG